jgi:hypothetical protein
LACKTLLENEDKGFDLFCVSFKLSNEKKKKQNVNLWTSHRRSS